MPNPQLPGKSVLHTMRGCVLGRSGGGVVTIGGKNGLVSCSGGDSIGSCLNAVLVKVWSGG